MFSLQVPNVHKLISLKFYTYSKIVNLPYTVYSSVKMLNKILKNIFITLFKVHFVTKKITFHVSPQNFKFFPTSRDLCKDKF